MAGNPIPDSFATTCWSVVMRAGRGTESERLAALDILCRTYWYPLYAYLRRCGWEPADAEDIVQGFFARLLDGSLLGSLTNSGRGRFRSLLLTALKNFATDTYRAATAIKRGGKVEQIPLDTTLAEEQWHMESGSTASPDQTYDRAWAAATLAAAGSRLRAEYERATKLPLFDALWPRISGTGGAAGNEEVGLALGLSSGAVATAATRLRERYAEAIRAEIAQCVETEGEIDEEIRHLLGLFSQAG